MSCRRSGCLDGQADTARARPEHATAAAIRRILEQRHDERLTLEVLADAFGLSPFQVLRTFQRHCGMTPHAYLVRFRVRKARALLLEGEPTAQVAAEVGFTDQSHMTKHFKKLLGTTPSRYRSALGARAETGAGAPSPA